MSVEKPKCSKCDSANWEGFLRCSVCGSYFILAKCKNCDNLRHERCPADGGKLELLKPKENEA